MYKYNFKILFYYPNLIGYLRVTFLVIAFTLLHLENVNGFIITYSLSIILDGFDGPIARKMNQCSKFGAWLDVVIDNSGRTLCWSYIHPMLTLISALEWLVFVCNHQLGQNWKRDFVSNVDNQRLSEKEDPNHFCEAVQRKDAKGPEAPKDKDYEPPVIVSRVMENNFKTPMGVVAIAGLNVLPLWLMGMKYKVFENSLYFIPNIFVLLGLLVFSIGRLLCAFVELWCVWRHVLTLLLEQ